MRLRKCPKWTKYISFFFLNTLLSFCIQSSFEENEVEKMPKHLFHVILSTIMYLLLFLLLLLLLLLLLSFFFYRVSSKNNLENI